MEIKHDGRSFHIADSCPVGALTRATLKRALKAHGVESFLASKKYGGQAACILAELEKAGAAVIPAR